MTYRPLNVMARRVRIRVRIGRIRGGPISFPVMARRVRATYRGKVLVPVARTCRATTVNVLGDWNYTSQPHCHGPACPGHLIQHGSAIGGPDSPGHDHWAEP